MLDKKQVATIASDVIKRAAKRWYVTPNEVMKKKTTLVQVNEARREAIVAMYDRDVSIFDIAEIFGFKSHLHVKAILKKFYR